MLAAGDVALLGVDPVRVVAIADGRRLHPAALRPAPANAVPGQGLLFDP